MIMNKNFTIIYGKNACFGSFDGFKNKINTRKIFEIFILQNKFDEYYKKVPNDLKQFVKKVNNHDLFVLTHEQDKHQGIALKVSNFNFLSLEEMLEKIDNKTKQQRYNHNNNHNISSIFLLDRIQDPHNVGNIIRSAFCFDVDAIILTERESCQITPAVVRTSAGYSENSLICQIGNTSQALEQLKKNGYWVIGFDVNTTTNYNLSQIVEKYDKCVFVFGSEGEGMKELTKKKCDLIIKLPMRAEAESLNVANTTAIVGWEIIKKKMQ